MALSSKACFGFQNLPNSNKISISSIIDAKISYPTTLLISPESHSIVCPLLRKARQTNKIASMASALTLQESSCIKSYDSFRDKLKGVGEATSFESLLMNDDVQQLGIDHHFQDEIEQLLQKHYPIYQQEILQFSRWWKELRLAKEIAFVRDQPLTWYSGSMGCLTDPSLSDERIELAKSISMVFIIDDIYDNFGTIGELTVFTEAVKKWDYADINRLPDYMKLCFKALYDITNGVSNKVYKKHGWNPIKSLRNMWAILCDAFLVEAKWFASRKLPNSEHYLKNGIISAGVHVILGHIFFLLGEDINKENLELLSSHPGIVSSTATILRLWDDIGSLEEEDQEGSDGSYVDCYMNEHQGITTTEAKKHVFGLISNAWKQLNQECLSTSPFSSSFKRAALNMARMVPMVYGKDENHSLKNIETFMRAIPSEPRT